MRERVVTFGPGRGLVGVLTEPDALRAELPALLLWNVGLNHRVGPNRLWVELARRLAASGVASLRFDASGLGDSVPRAGGGSDVERGAADVADAMSFLERRLHVRAFVPVSLCSGTDAGHLVTVADPRVRGSVFLDGFAYPTPRFRRLDSTLGRMTSWWRWRRWLWRQLAGGGAPGQGRSEGAIFARAFPPVRQFVEDLDRVAAREVELLYVFTGEAQWFLYRDQLHDLLASPAVRRRLEVEHWPALDHLFSSRAARALLAGRLERFLLERCARPAADAAPAATAPAAR